MSKTNFFGITPEARSFLNHSTIPRITRRNNKTFLEPDSENSGEKCGLFDEINLKKYYLKNGTAIEFIENDKNWIKGNCIFLGLRVIFDDNSIREYLWNEEMNVKLDQLLYK